MQKTRAVLDTCKLSGRVGLLVSTEHVLVLQDVAKVKGSAAWLPEFKSTSTPINCEAWGTSFTSLHPSFFKCQW